ncbi:MAG TPA: hypothetical protein VFE46_01850 [Pirellulales bacterium]|nr:hypothetical protein [Pirellulales bacterium]
MGTFIPNFYFRAKTALVCLVRNLAGAANPRMVVRLPVTERIEFAYGIVHFRLIVGRGK